MALLPLPLPRPPRGETIAAAAGNVAHKLLYGGLADLRPMPRTLIDEGTLRELYHYRPSREVAQQGDPVLLVTPLAAPSTCYDLRRGCSLVEHLIGKGRPTYLVEYGEISFRNRTLGMEHWIEKVVPSAIREVSAQTGRPVHVVAWSLGGTFTLLAAAAYADLPIASITIFGTPIDVSQVPLIAPLRPLVDLTDGRLVTALYQALGGAPKPLVRWAFQLSSIDKVVTKPLALLSHLDDLDYLAQIEAVDRFTAGIIAYPGRTFGQLYHRFVHYNELVDGHFDLEDRQVSLRDIRQPVQIFAGATDGIAPVPSVRHLVSLLDSSEEVQFDVVPGGHLGMLTGRGARTNSWPTLDRWLAKHDGRSLEEVAGEAPTDGAAGAPPAKPAIGANPRRRYSSSSSRALRKS